MAELINKRIPKVAGDLCLEVPGSTKLWSSELRICYLERCKLPTVKIKYTVRVSGYLDLCAALTSIV